MHFHHRRNAVRNLLGTILMTAAFSAGAQAPIPFKSTAVEGEGSIARTALGFMATVLALGISLHLLRKRIRPDGKGVPGARQVRLLETRRLTPRTTLFVVEFAGARYLIAESGQSLCRVGVAPLQSSPGAGLAE